MQTHPPSGSLGIALAGLGAVATTVVAGVSAVRQGLVAPVGSLTELRDDWRGAVAPLDGLRFGAWDVHGLDALTVARQAAALPQDLIEAVAPDLSALHPRPGAFLASVLPGTRAREVIVGSSAEQLERLRADLRDTQTALGADRMVVLWSGSTEAWPEPPPWTDPYAALERDEPLPGSLLYCMAAIEEGVPFATLAPCGGADLPAIQARARDRGTPIAGSDLKTGQTWLKAVLAEAISDRLLGVDGWFSLNLLGNDDGKTLRDPASYAQKRRTKAAALAGVLDGDRWPQLYGGLQHEVRIEHYRPRGDAKEAWDTIDLRGWGGRRMQLKLDLLGWDSALAAPLALDLARLLDLAARAGRSGPQEWLGWYFKEPIGDAPGPLSGQRALLERAVAELSG